MLIYDNKNFHLGFQSKKNIPKGIVNKFKTPSDEFILSDKLTNLNPESLVDPTNKIGYTKSCFSKLKEVLKESLDNHMCENNVLKKLKEVCFSNLEEPVYFDVKNNVDEDNIAILITKYFDKNGVLRKLESKDKFSDMILSAELYNENGCRTYKVLTINQPDGNVLVSKSFFDGQKDSNLLSCDRILVDFNKT